MYKQCKTEQSAARQRELELGLLQAMSGQQYDAISVSDLCGQIGIPRKSFYRYFSSKEGALHALLDHSMLEYESFAFNVRTAGERSFASDLENYFEYWLRQKPLLDALERSGLSGVLIERAIRHAVSEVALPKRFLLREKHSMQEQITMFSMCGLMSMVVTWHHEGYPEPPAAMAKVATRLLTQPLFSNSDHFY